MTDKEIDWDKPLELCLLNSDRWNRVWKSAIFFDKDGEIEGYKVDDEAYSYEFYANGDPKGYGYKIRNAPEKKVLKGWVNIYSQGGATKYSLFFETKKEADMFNVTRIACLYVEKEYYEGEGLEGE